ncbi:hypothetical protein AMTR_s00116p00098250 [Amborella trichopoda]|uniref:Uncharacterized protein n=1 Tax=Amborella trichopoda TaxID=13333 RepID=W1NSJ6_AMBTC|nr:hypothetical protein AMTR_s00116p00098250 [Amborella trichopoda]
MVCINETLNHILNRHKVLENARPIEVSSHHGANSPFEPQLEEEERRPPPPPIAQTSQPLFPPVFPNGQL